MTRRPLPNRRPCITTDTIWQGIPLTVTVGYFPDGPEAGQPAEVFADPTGAEARHSRTADMLSDAACATSIALQCGAAPADLKKSLGRTPDPVLTANEALRKADCEAAGEPYEPRDTTVPASPVGAIMAVVLDADKLAGVRG